VRQQCRSAAVSTLAGAVFASIVASTKRVRLASFAKQWYSKRQLKRRQMPTRNISLTAEQDAFVQEVVEAGEYQNASEAIRDALRVLQQRRKEDTLKLKVLRAQIKAGTDALDRGDFTEVDDADLEGYLDRLTTPAAKRAR
jgi:antitoxin ParD1/3/4